MGVSLRGHDALDGQVSEAGGVHGGENRRSLRREGLVADGVLVDLVSPALGLGGADAGGLGGGKGAGRGHGAAEGEAVDAVPGRAGGQGLRRRAAQRARHEVHEVERVGAELVGHGGLRCWGAGRAGGCGAGGHGRRMRAVGAASADGGCGRLVRRARTADAGGWCGERP